MSTLTHLDELPQRDGPIAADAILTDEQLERGGLVKVEAFMRTRTSAAAARKAKQRDRDESDGLKQVNIKTTEEAGTALKNIAAEIGRGATLVDAIVKAVPSVTSHALVLTHISNDTCIMLSHIHSKMRSWPCDRPNCILPMRIVS